MLNLLKQTSGRFDWQFSYTLVALSMAGLCIKMIIKWTACIKNANRRTCQVSNEGYNQVLFKLSIFYLCKKTLKLCIPFAGLIPKLSYPILSYDSNCKCGTS